MSSIFELLKERKNCILQRKKSVDIEKGRKEYHPTHAHTNKIFWKGIRDKESSVRSIALSSISSEWAKSLPKYKPEKRRTGLSLILLCLEKFFRN